MQQQEILSKIHETLAHIRPYLQNDGGDVEFVNMTEDMVVHVRLKGACVSCPHSHMTMHNGIREAIMRDIPEVRNVVALEEA